MTALPAHVRAHLHQLAGLECSPAPRGLLHALGVVVIATLLWPIPTSVLRWLSSRTYHVRLEKES